MQVISIVDLDSPTAWMAQGLCREYGPNFFFPEDGAGVIRAQKVCKHCPVIEECLDHALENQIEHGVWGGTSERKRRRMRKAREAQEVAALKPTG